MKRILFALLTSLLALPIYSFDSTLPNDSLSADTTQELQDRIDDVMSIFSNTLPSDLGETKEYIDTIISKITAKLDQTLSPSVQYALEYLQYRVDQLDASLGEIEEAVETEEDDELPTEELTPAIDVSTYHEQDRYIVIGGNTSDPILKFDINALYEDIRVEEITVGANYDLFTYIERVDIYDEEGNHIVGGQPVGSSIIFDGLDVIIPQHEVSYYMTITPYRIGKNYAGNITDQLRMNLKITEAYGEITNDRLSKQPTYTSEDIVIVPVGIASVEFVDEALGRNISSVLTKSKLTLGIVKITADNRPDNRQDVLINKITITDNGNTEFTSDRIILERIGKNSEVRSANRSAQGEYVFDVKQRREDRHLDSTFYTMESGDIYYYAISGSPTQTDGSISLSLENLLDGGIEYGPYEGLDITIIGGNINSIRTKQITD